MNPADSKGGKKGKMDLMDLVKRPRKMDKFDKITGLGPANRKMIKEQMKSLQGSKGGKNVKDLGTFNIGNLQEILMEGGENAFDFEGEEFSLDPRILNKLKLDSDFFDKIDDDFEDDI